MISEKTRARNLATKMRAAMNGHIGSQTRSQDLNPSVAQGGVRDIANLILNEIGNISTNKVEEKKLCECDAVEIQEGIIGWCERSYAPLSDPVLDVLMLDWVNAVCYN